MAVVIRTACLMILALAALGTSAHKTKNSEVRAKMKILRCTPIQVVDAIEPNLEFWENRLGYKRTAEVPPGAKQLYFVILEKDGLEVMLQTRKSVEEDLSSAKPMEHFKGNQTILYIEVDSLEEAAKALKGVPVVMGPIDRPYGMRELTVKDPSGYAVCLAQQIK